MNQETEDSASIEIFSFLLSMAQRAAGQSLKQKTKRQRNLHNAKDPLDTDV